MTEAIQDFSVQFDGPEGSVTSLGINWHHLESHSAFLYARNTSGDLVLAFALPHSALEELAQDYLRSRGINNNGKRLEE